MLVPPSPLPWLPRCRRHCRRRHCHCYGCRHLRRHQHRFCCHCYRFLVDCCLPLPRPCAASAWTTIACPRACRCWLPMPLPLSSRLQTAAPCSFRRNRMMFKILHLKSNILNIYAATFWLIVVCPCAASAFTTVACPRRCAFVSLLIVVMTCAASTVSCLSSTTAGGSSLMFKILLLQRNALYEVCWSCRWIHLIILH